MLSDRFEEGQTVFMAPYPRRGMENFGSKVTQGTVVGFTKCADRMFIRIAGTFIIEHWPGSPNGCLMVTSTKNELSQRWNREVDRGLDSEQVTYESNRALWERLRAEEENQ